MKLSVKKRHNKDIEIRDGDKFLSVKGLVIEASAGYNTDTLKVILTFPNNDVKSLNYPKDSITLDMEFGGGYKLLTDSPSVEWPTDTPRVRRDGGPSLLYMDKLVVRIQVLRYEINIDTTIGKMFLEMSLT